MLTRLAHVVARHRWLVLGAWLLLTLFGAFAATQVADRWYTATAIPGQPAYEASQRSLHAARGRRPHPRRRGPHRRRATSPPARAVEQAMQRAGDCHAGRVHQLVLLHRRPGVRLRRPAHRVPDDLPARARPASTCPSSPRTSGPPRRPGLPDGTTRRGDRPRRPRRGHQGRRAAGPACCWRPWSAAVGALVVLLFVFGTLPAVLTPLVIALAAILNTFTLVWALTYVTDVSIIVPFLIGLVGLGLAIDYALVDHLPVPGRAAGGPRRRDGPGRDDDARRPLGRRLRLDRRHRPAGDGRAAPAADPVHGHRRHAHPRRLRPRLAHPAAGAAGRARRPDQRGPRHAAAAARHRPRRGRRLGPLGPLRPPAARRSSPPPGCWWSSRSPAFGTQLKTGETELEHFPGSGTAIAGRQLLADAGISPGVMKPLNVLVEGGDPQQIAARLRTVDGLVGAVAPATWRAGDTSLVEAFPAFDGAAPAHPGRPRPRRTRRSTAPTAPSPASPPSTGTSCTPCTAAPPTPSPWSCCSRWSCSPGPSAPSCSRSRPSCSTCSRSPPPSASS